MEAGALPACAALLSSGREAPSLPGPAELRPRGRCRRTRGAAARCLVRWGAPCLPGTPQGCPHTQGHPHGATSVPPQNSAACWAPAGQDRRHPPATAGPGLLLARAHSLHPHGAALAASDSCSPASPGAAPRVALQGCLGGTRRGTRGQVAQGPFRAGALAPSPPQSLLSKVGGGQDSGRLFSAQGAPQSGPEGGQGAQESEQEQTAAAAAPGGGGPREDSSLPQQTPTPGVFPPEQIQPPPGAGIPGPSPPPGPSGGGLSLWGMFSEPIAARHPSVYYPGLMNRDFMPTLAQERILNTWDIVSLWVGLVVGVPTWYLAGSLVELGMSWWQGILTVFAGNVLVLLPMLFNGHPGCKYGIPFPVLARAAFGVYGANVPSMLRGMVACGWFGIQTWIGGQAISQLAHRLLALAEAQGLPGAAALALWGVSQVDALSISWLDLGSFLSFWFVQLGIVWNGIESIKTLEAYSAPILVSLCGALLVWAVATAGGFGPMLSTPSAFGPGQPRAGQFWATFFPALTANVGFWATLSLNIPDFTRYARSQRVQAVGQMLGLPPFMAAFSFVGLAVTSATTVIFGQVISDPIALLGRLQGLLPSLLSVLGLILATLTTNIAANVVAPANALVNLAPGVFSFRTAGLVTALLGVLMAPWRLVQSSDDFIFRWLIGYSALLGPVAGVVISDYFVLRRCELDIDALFSNSPSSQYWYTDGVNLRALLALAAGVLPNLPGFLEALGVVTSVPAFCKVIYGNAWVAGFSVSGLVYYCLMRQTISAVSVSLQAGSNT